jgi:hypothetical protein
MILRFSRLAADAHVAQVQRVSAMRVGWRVFPSGFNCGLVRLRFGGDAEPAAPPSESSTARRLHSIKIRAVITLVWWLTSDHAKQGRAGCASDGVAKTRSVRHRHSFRPWADQHPR